MADSEEPDAKRSRLEPATTSATTTTTTTTTTRKLRIKKKVYPSIAQYPTVDFRALLEPEKEKIERDSLAVISVRGKGSGFSVQDDEGKDPLHVYIEAESEDHAHKAERLVRDVINDPSKLPPPVQTQMVVRQSIFGTRTGIKPGDAVPQREQQQDFYKEVRVPDDVAGGIIGRNGETVKRMERDTSTRIHINRDANANDAPGTRVIAIRGPSQDAVDRCEQLVQEFVRGRAAQQQNVVVASAAPRASSSPSPPRTSGDGYSRMPYAQQQQQQVTEYHAIPNHKAGSVIGKGGSVVKALQSKYRARVTVPPTADAANPNFRTIVIVADSKQIADLVKQDVDLIVEGKAGFIGNPNDVSTPVRIPDDKAGLIIGKQGATIKSIQERMGVRIQIPQQADEGSVPPTRTASVIGRPEMVLAAIEEIDKIISGELYNVAGGGGSNFSAAPSSTSSHYQHQQQQQQQQPPQQDFSQQWEDYYRQLNQLPPEQRELALKALQEHQRSLGM